LIHYQKRSLYRELHSVPRARSKALGTGTLCREHQIELSAQKKPAVQTVFAEREQSRLSAQPRTHDTEALWRELPKQALGIAKNSRQNGMTVTAVGPAVKCAQSPPLALGKEFCVECLIKALGKELKNQIHTFKPFASSTYTPTKSICSNFT
jgi:hypothetical protein